MTDEHVASADESPDEGRYGDFDYEQPDIDYSSHRQADPRIAARIHAALGDARTVLNVGAGTGSYEPLDRYVIAVEPSEAMRRQRPVALPPAVNAVAACLPFDDRSFDASMASMTIHQWADPWAGLAELRRVTRGPIVLFTFDPDAVDRLWLWSDYAPELRAVEQRRFPKIDSLRAALGPRSRVEEVAIARDATDGFAEAYFAQPEVFLRPEVRRAQSSWGFLEPGVEEAIVERLDRELRSGEWDRKYGELRHAQEFRGALRLVIGEA